MRKTGRIQPVSYTHLLTLKSTGDNPAMSQAQGVNVKLNKVVGLAIANGIVALAGAMLAQYKGSANKMCIRDRCRPWPA